MEDPPQQSLYEDGALVHPHRDNLRHGGSHVGPAVRVLCVHEVDDRKAGDDQGRDEHHPDQPGREGRGLVRDLVVRGLVVPPQGESVELVLDESLLGEEGRGDVRPRAHRGKSGGGPEEAAYLECDDEANVGREQDSRQEEPEKECCLGKGLFHIESHRFPHVPANDNVQAAQEALTHQVGNGEPVQELPEDLLGASLSERISRRREVLLEFDIMVHVVHQAAQPKGSGEKEPGKPELVQVPEALGPLLDAKQGPIESAGRFHDRPDGHGGGVLDPDAVLDGFHLRDDVIDADGNGPDHEGPNQYTREEEQDVLALEGVEHLNVHLVLLQRCLLEHYLELLAHPPPVLPGRLNGDEVEVPRREGCVAKLLLIFPVDREKAEQGQKSGCRLLVLKREGGETLEGVPDEDQKPNHVCGQEREGIGQVESVRRLLFRVPGIIRVQEARLLQVLYLEYIRDARSLGWSRGLPLKEDKGKDHRSDPDDAHQTHKQADPHLNDEHHRGPCPILSLNLLQRVPARRGALFTLMSVNPVQRVSLSLSLSQFLVLSSPYVNEESERWVQVNLLLGVV